MLAAAHGLDEAYPTLITMHELKHGILKPEQLKNIREYGGIKIIVTLTTDAESVYKSLTAKDIKTPTEKTLMGHVAWIREMMQLGIVDEAQWCDTRDMTADGHTKGCIDRKMLIDLMHGIQHFNHEVKTYRPFRGTQQMVTKRNDNENANASDGYIRKRRPIGKTSLNAR